MYRITVAAFGPVLIAGASVAPAQEAPCGGELSQQFIENDPGIDRTYLRRVRVVGPGVAWAVGNETTTDESLTVTLRYMGGSWSRAPSPSPENAVGDSVNELFDVDGTSPDDVWAVGGYTNEVIHARDTLALHWNGSSWAQVITPGQSEFGTSGFHFEAVRAIGEGDVWFGGQSMGCLRGEAYLVHRDGSGDFDVYCVEVGLNGVARVRDIDALGSDDVWAVGAWGGDAVAVGVPFAVHWDGSGWTVNSPPQTDHGEVLYAVSMISTDDVWATGEYQRVVDGRDVTFPLYWHWDGSSWTRHEASHFAVDLAPFAADDIYGVSGGGIVHWDGAAWTPLDQGFDPGGAWAVGMSGIDALGPCDLLFAGHTLLPWEGVLGRMTDSGCAADFNGDGDVSTLDVLAFLNAWTTGDSGADFNSDGEINTLDVLAFLNAWGAGC